MTGGKHDLALLTWPEVAAAADRGAVAILPVASTEQHGPHLPVATDALIAHALANAIADDEGIDAIVAPTITYGYRSRPLSGGGQNFPGTTSVSGRTLMAVIEDVLRELVRQGFRRLVVLCHHLENRNFAYEAAYEVVGPRNDDGVRVVVFEDYPAFSDMVLDVLYRDRPFPGWDLEHASLFETSLMLHLHPELVRLDRIGADGPERVPWYDVLPIPERLVPSSGSLSGGDGASAEKGALAWDELVAGFRNAIRTEFPR